MAELGRFEAELQGAGLSEHTAGTYAGHAETFILWLRGAYTPHGPDSPRIAPAENPERSLGVSTLEDLRTNISRGDITRYLAQYAAVTGYDGSYRRLLQITSGAVDLQAEAHRVAVIGWLRAWGCRHLRRTDTHRTAETLRIWWEQWGERLPDGHAMLTELRDAQLLAAEQAYDALRAAPAAGRTLKGREIDVAFGDTAAAKVMFAARPQVFMPWDEPIRLAFGWWGGGASYVQLLRHASSTLEDLASRLAVSVADLPQALGRSKTSPPKLVDEFLWTRITKGL